VLREAARRAIYGRAWDGSGRARSWRRPVSGRMRHKLELLRMAVEHRVTLKAHFCAFHSEM
jgi:hypothetical protein